MRDPRGAVAIGLLSLLVAIEASDRATDSHAHGDMGPLGRLAGSLRDRLLDVVGPDDIVERLDVNAVLARVDLEEVLERVDINALLARVDVNRLLAGVDIDALLSRIEPDALFARVDIDVLLARIDLNHLLARVDLDRVIAQVDVEHVVRRAGIPDIVAESTSSLAERTLDLLRRQLLGVDVVATRAVMRVLSRDVRALPSTPVALAREGVLSPSMPAPTAPTDDVTGQYAGPVTRLVAFLVDMFLAGGAFTVVSGALGSALRAVGAIDDGSGRGVMFGTAAVAWLFIYWWASTAVTGHTPGMALVGLRVVARFGAPMSGRRAFLRVVMLPLSVGLFGLGLLVMLVDPERRALHDVVAGSTVVYDWGGRSATLPTPLAHWLEHHDVPTDAAINPRAPGAGSAGAGHRH
jgi:uncharacterized RDD family membrane protein YckC